MSLYWVSFTSNGVYHDESRVPFQFWTSGDVDRETGLPLLVYHALLEAPSASQLWEAIRKLYPDCKARICQQMDPTWQPPEKHFPGFQNRTSIEHTQKIEIVGQIQI